MEGEIIPQGMSTLRSNVRLAWGLSATAVGIIGNDAHRYGYHRSRNWIYNYGDGGEDYSVQHPLDRTGDPNWVTGMDISLSPDLMKVVSVRLYDAAIHQDPRMAIVREFYGTVDGENVIGWDIPSNSFASSDTSHLTHVHLSFHRSHGNDDLTPVLDVMLGKDTFTMDAETKRLLYAILMYVKLDYDNWAPTRQQWIDAKGSAEMWDAMASFGSGLNADALNDSAMRTGIVTLLEKLNSAQTPVIDYGKLVEALKPVITEIISDGVANELSLRLGKNA